MPTTIGIILDHDTQPTYSKFPWYALREHYFSCFKETGVTCLGLPYHEESIEGYLDTIDGLLIPGGDFDIDPSLYGDTAIHETVTTRSNRTAFEFSITEKALARDMPILAICGGHQLLNVILGGTLIQHIPDEVETDINHEQPTPRSEPYHTVSIQSETRLHRLVETNEMFVNSAHHQAIKDVAPDLIVNAHAPDGIIEGVESKNHTFCLGIQWHPEILVDPRDQKIIQGFVEAAGAQTQKHPGNKSKTPPNLHNPL